MAKKKESRKSQEQQKMKMKGKKSQRRRRKSVKKVWACELEEIRHERLQLTKMMALLALDPQEKRKERR